MGRGMINKVIWNSEIKRCATMQQPFQIEQYSKKDWACAPSLKYSVSGAQCQYKNWLKLGSLNDWWCHLKLCNQQPFQIEQYIKRPHAILSDNGSVECKVPWIGLACGSRVTFLCKWYHITCTKIIVLCVHFLKLFIASGAKTFICTMFRSARVQKWVTFALGVHITLECSVFPIKSSDVCSNLEEAIKRRERAKLYAGQMQQTQCVRLAWSKRPRNISCEATCTSDLFNASAKVVFRSFFFF